MNKNIAHILPQGEQMKKLNQSPFKFLEGPVWCKMRKTLFFSDPLAQTIIAMNSDGAFTTIQHDSGYVNGMCLNSESRLVVCKMETGRVEEVDPDTGKTIRIISSGYQNRPFNATNDVVCDRAGGLYVTDPIFTYGPGTQEVEATYYVMPDGQTKRVATNSIKPNGLALSRDGKRLFIDDTLSTNVWCYDVGKDGTLSNPKVFCHVQPPEDISTLPPIQQYGEADGLKVDSQGNVYVTTFNGIQIFNACGALLGTIPMPADETAANVAFGGEQFTTLYITARASLYSISVRIPGL